MPHLKWINTEPEKDKYYYDGLVVEEKCAFIADWSEINENPHRDCELTKDYASNGEHFGLNRGLFESFDSEVALDNEIARFFDTIQDGTLNENSVSEDDDPYFHQNLPESANWRSKKLGTKRAWGPISSEAEKKFFEDNLLSFQSIAFRKFAMLFNETIVDEESNARPKTDMTFKTAFHLQEYWERNKRESKWLATLLDHKKKNTKRKALRHKKKKTNRKARHKKKNTNRKALHHNQVTTQIPAATLDSTLEFRVSNTENVSTRVRTQPFAGLAPENVTVDDLGPREPESSTPSNSKKNKRNKPKRCRICGWNPLQLSENHEGFSWIPTAGKMPHEVCTVPENRRCRGFPILTGPLPRYRSSSNQ